MKDLIGNTQSTWSIRNIRTRVLILLVVIIVFSASLLLSNIDISNINNIGWFPSPVLENTSTKNTNHDNKDTHYHNHNDNNSDNHDPKSEHSVPLGPLEPAISLLDPNTKYISYLPFAGLTNQFIGLENAAFIAKRLNRTLIIPPIMSNTHDHDNTHQRWSRYFDLTRFTLLTGVPILEWDTVRPLTPAQRKVGRDQALLNADALLTVPRGEIYDTEEWSRVTENITCQIIDGYGTVDLPMNPSAFYFIWHFLFRPITVDPPKPKPGMENLARTEVKYVGQRIGDIVIMDDLISRYEDSSENLLFLSHTFKLKDVKEGGTRLWDEIGASFHFVPQLMEYATIRINQVLKQDKGIEVLPNNDPEEDINDSITKQDEEVVMPIIPANKNSKATESGEISNPATSDITAPVTRIPHIAVHLRRGDIANKCTGGDVTKCVIPLERYEISVAHAREMAAKRGLHSSLPVVVTTDTTSLEDIQRLNELGWHRIDHTVYGTAELWGSFGEAMVDAAILAHADQFVGSEISTMSKIAAQRQKSWYDHQVIFPSWKSDVDKVVKKRSMDGEGRRMRRRRRMFEDEDVSIVY